MVLRNVRGNFRHFFEEVNDKGGKCEGWMDPADILILAEEISEKEAT